MIKLQISIDAQFLNLKKEDLIKLKVSLNDKNVEYKFISFEQLHIPILTIYSKDDSELESISKLVESVLKNHSSFDLKLSGLWAYPNQGAGRLIYMGVQNTKELRSLQEDLDQAFSQVREEEYKPNLPLVRLKNHRNVTDAISPYKTRDFGKLQVQRVMLYEITSGGAYMTYKILKTFSMGDIMAPF